MMPTSSPSSVSAALDQDAIHQLEITLQEPFPAMVMQSRGAWRRDLPILLKSNPGQWVAYHGDKQMGIGRTKTELFQQCLHGGLQRGQFIVLLIEPEVEHEVDMPMDV